MSASILIVEDEAAIHQLLDYNLKAEGYRTRIVETGEEVHGAIHDEMPDLIVLDWMLPGLSGIEVCKLIRAREETRALPIVMLTARGEEAERLRGLSTGADDYIVKPFSVPEVMARIRAILRRVNPESVSDQITFGDITVDRARKRVMRGNREVQLSPTEFRLLEYLMQSPGRVYSRAQLLDRVWGNDAEVDERTVDVHVGRLRKNLSRGKQADPIRTVRSSGYAIDEKFHACD
jgi:two-component system, OmpR family, phosphate regulon response regulator PhoB